MDKKSLTESLTDEEIAELELSIKRDPLRILIIETKERISKTDNVDDYCKYAEVLINAYDKYMNY